MTEAERRAELARDFYENFDAYGKDLAKPTTGKDAVYRIVKNKKGEIARLTQVEEEK